LSFKKKIRLPHYRSLNPLQFPRMVINPFRNRVQFLVETVLLSGTLGRLFLAAALIFGVALITGLFGYLVAMGTEQSFSNPWDAVWWAFLRLSDPGYLGDDVGFSLRVVSTVVTIAGYVLFLGVLVAILTQGLNEKIRKLEMGLAPISAQRHILLLGWTNRTPWMVRDFIASEGRVRRFLRRIGARRLKLVLMVEEVRPWQSAELRTFLGPEWKRSRVILRSGTPLRLDHLMRVDFLRASAIVLPARDRGNTVSAAQADNATVKTILSVSHSLYFSNSNLPPPLLVAELYDSRKIPTALHSYQGPIEVVAGDEVLSRMIAQLTRNPQLGFTYRELLSQGVGSEIFIRDCPASMMGRDFWEVAQTACESVWLGVARLTMKGVEPILNPPAGFRIEEGDKLVSLARNWEQSMVTGKGGGSGWPNPSKGLKRRKRGVHNVLILGWSRRIPALIDEYESYTNQQFDLTIAGRLPIESREEEIRQYGVEVEGARLKHVVADYTIPDRLRALRPENFDSIIFLSSDLTESDEEADACNLVAYTILKRERSGHDKPPRYLLELLDELNVSLIDPQDSEYILSPHVLSHMLAQVSMRRELNAIYHELFNSSETEILFRDFQRYNLDEGRKFTFSAIERSAREHGEIALGVFKAGERTSPHGGVTLNPEKNSQWELEAEDQLIVLRK